MSATASITGVRELADQLGSLAKAVDPTELAEELGRNELERLRGFILAQGLFRTGNYLASWDYSVEDGELTLGTDAPQANIQEYGGTINARPGGWLVFKIEEQWVKVRSVFIPAKPHLRPSLVGVEERIAEMIKNVVKGAL